MKLTPGALRTLIGLIYDSTGVVLSEDKAYLVQHRLEPVARDFGFADFDSMANELRSVGPHSRLHERVVDAITTHETSFFRDPWFFEILQQHVLPERVAQLRSGRDGRHRIRIWSAGSATGQEAYSMAMIVREMIDKSAGTLKEAHFTIVANDISAEVIGVAREGRFSQAEVAKGIPNARLGQHLVRDGAGWIVSEPVRRLVQFRKFNLLHCPADIGTFDLVLCRNVMIYFDEKCRQRVVEGIQAVLHPGGWFGVGAAESLHGCTTHLEAVHSGRAILYRMPSKPA